MKGAKPSELKVIQGGIVDAPSPPKHLPKEVHTEWNIVASDLAARKLLSESMLGVIETYCFARYQILECQKAIQELGLFVRNKDGVPKPNPANSTLQKAQEMVARLAVELGLTPSSRSRKGLSGPKDDEDEGINKFV
jgi:P27 family predicted phage terminase small subunit